MNRLRKFLALTPGERRVLLRAAFLLIRAEVCLRMLPLSKVMHWGQSHRSVSFHGVQPTPERIAWLVEAAARHGLLRGRLQPTCLRKSLVLYRLLRERGCQPRLVIGARSAADHSGPARFRAHAWVEFQGRLLGPVGAIGFDELASLETIFSRRQVA